RVPDRRDPWLKTGRDVRALPAQDQPVRLEVILAATPFDDERSWRQELTLTAPDAVIEGRMGPIVTLRLRPSQAVELAKLPLVSAVRLPRPASVAILPPAQLPKENRAVLAATGLDSLHAMGFRGQRVRVAVVAGDFGSYEQFVGKQLPAGTRYIDFTAACEPNIEPRK